MVYSLALLSRLVSAAMQRATISRHNLLRDHGVQLFCIYVLVRPFPAPFCFWVTVFTRLRRCIVVLWA